MKWHWIYLAGLFLSSCGEYYEYYEEVGYDRGYRSLGISHISFMIESRAIEGCFSGSVSCHMQSSGGVNVSSASPFAGNCDYQNVSHSCGVQRLRIDCYDQPYGSFLLDVYNESLQDAHVSVSYHYYTYDGWDEIAVDGFWAQDIAAWSYAPVPVAITP